ncbi:DNA-binding protein [Henriciella barbarensis]|uniref:DNA-binding protein n=1 Tax=Henriciella barbarensis TaxID=86342 RepID=A0A399QZZ1_9PROT|nr:DNA-binding protein [Henriciella barbarensis]
MNTERLLSTKELARKLNVSHRTLENYRQSGRGPIFFRLGPKAVRYLWSDVIDWLRRKS